VLDLARVVAQHRHLGLCIVSVPYPEHLPTPAIGYAAHLVLLDTL
jgi:hypothetical protein